MANIANHELLAAALVGCQHQLQDLQARIAAITARLKGKAAAKAAVPGKCRVLSAAARKRMAAGQKKRWAAYKKARAGSAAA
jgi:hypothetical protein